jgi:hypothetical protein
MAQISTVRPERSTVQVLWERFRGILGQQAPLLVFVVLFLFATFRYDGFFSEFNLKNLLFV